MLKKLILIGIATLTLSNVFAQDKNTIYLEGGGAAILYSFNYERNITDKITARIGFSSLPFTSEDTGEAVTFTLIPIMANYLIGGGNHKLAISGGVLQISASADAEDGEYDVDLGMIPTYGVGYRYHRSTGGFFFNASVGFAPVVMPGVAFGWTF
ncbi:MAG: hypothetical protein HOF97_04370 [Candidatus Marinimicrobia bacterium]|nr:hypothetical protein [Candidatus Neomarinimicrobiota bacterium]